MTSRLKNGVVKYFKDNIGIIIALFAMCIFLVIFPTTRATFLTPKNVFNILRQNASNLFLATGMTMVIILGGIELSVGSVIALSGVVAAGCVVNFGLPEVVAFLAAVGVGALVGMFNGFVICKTDIPPFIVTLASMNITKGIALVLTGGSPIRCMTDAFKFPGAGYVGPVPTPVILMIVVFIVATFMVNRTQLGRHIYAVGGNQQSAALMGLDVKKTQLKTYILCSFLTSIGGICFCLNTMNGTVGQATGLEMSAISSAVIGGTLLTGGVGNVFGSLFGVLINGTISSLVQTNGKLISSWANIVTAILLCFFILLQAVFAKIKERNK